MTEPTPDTKHCPKCGEDLLRSEFGPSKSTKDGLFGWCRSCKRRGDLQSHTDHRESRTRKMRERYHANPEPQQAASRARTRANPEENRARATAWNKANVERRRYINRSWQHRTYAADPERFREVWRRREAVIRQGVTLVPFTLDQLAAKVAYWGNRCRWCGGPFEAIDHVKPLAAGGPHMLANLTPSCRRCNATKRDMWPLTAWLVVLDRLLVVV